MQLKKILLNFPLLKKDIFIMHVLTIHKICYSQGFSLISHEIVVGWLVGWLSEFSWRKAQKGHAAPKLSLNFKSRV